MPRLERENTIPSFLAAVAAGADAIELDVHATSDDVVVVHHDPVTHEGIEIAKARWADLRRTAAGPEGAPPIPSLGAVCDVIGDRVELLVEIKGAGIEAAVVDVLRTRVGRFALHSFDHETIGRLSRLRVDYRLGLLFEEEVSDPAALLARFGAQDAWPHHSLVDRPLVDAVHRAGGRVIPWTVNSPSEVRRMAEAGVDGICTDDVTLLDALRR